MKNIHILPTDKPSRLSIINSQLIFSKEYYVNPQNIYITSDEEIKEGDWFLPKSHINPHKLKEFNKINGDLESYNGLCYDISKCKKIILTTDQDLINDGVQAIDDEFLDWFVKNPSCEEVETHIVKLCTNCGQQYCDNRDCRGYNDEPEYLISYPENTTQEIITYCDGYEVNTEKIIIPKKELERGITITHVGKQETLEEVAKRTEFERYGQTLTNYTKQRPAYNLGFNNGAKWQQERSYSEEEVKNLTELFLPYYFKSDKGFDDAFNEWFEQFKKK